MSCSNIDHISISAPKDEFENVIEWYKAALTPLKYRELMRFPGAVGLGNEVPDFWITERESKSPQGLHVAFKAPGRLHLYLISRW